MSSKIYKVYIKTNYLNSDDWSLVGSYKLHSNAVEVRDDYNAKDYVTDSKIEAEDIVRNLSDFDDRDIVEVVSEKEDLKMFKVMKAYAERSYIRKNELCQGFAVENDPEPTEEASFETLEEAREYLKGLESVVGTFKTAMMFVSLEEYFIEEFDEENDVYTIWDTTEFPQEDFDKLQNVYFMEVSK